MIADREAAAARFVRWLDHRLTEAGRGDRVDQLEVDPGGRFWLGRLAPEEAVIAVGLGDRGERIDPCSVGIRLLPRDDGPWEFTVTVRCRAWVKQTGIPVPWRKTREAEVRVPVEVPEGPYSTTSHGAAELATALGAAVGVDGLSAEVRVEVETRDGRQELVVAAVNTSPRRHPELTDTNLYEVVVSIEGIETDPFQLEALPDSFRFDRDVPAYGVNCGVEVDRGTFVTTDTIVVDRGRPSYWSLEQPAPDLTFESLSEDPLGSVRALVDCAGEWGRRFWSTGELDRREETDLWTLEMRAEANRAAAEFDIEVGRMAEGVRLLEEDGDLLRVFPWK